MINAWAIKPDLGGLLGLIVTIISIPIILWILKKKPKDVVEYLTESGSFFYLRNNKTQI